MNRQPSENAASELRDLARLQQGTAKQRAALRVLKPVFEQLAHYQPVLVGTVPLGIDVEGSDLDVLCCFGSVEAERFEVEMRSLFADCLELPVWLGDVRGEPTVICRVNRGGFQLEVFGQAVPVHEQWAFRHMKVESRVLELAPHSFRDRVVELKQRGVKTEPAFAQLLGLRGEPYEAMLELGECSDEELRRLLRGGGASW